MSAERITDLLLSLAGDSPLPLTYVDFNRRCFDGKLSVKNVEIGWGNLTGTYYTNYEGDGFRARISIIQTAQLTESLPTL